MPRITFFSLYLFFWLANMNAQGKPDFRSPLGIPLRLSATFGELRTNSLHSGIDIRTNETTGWPVYAVADGSITRIKVEPGGFGKAIYISHPNGYMTVYAHLDHFPQRIREYVEQQQYALEQFQVDLFPKAADLPVKKGDTIAFSGNSGGSSGPHLHFEVRDDATQNILNPLLFGFPVTDPTPPSLQILMLYPLDSRSKVQEKAQAVSVSPTRISGIYRLPGLQVPKVQGRVAFGVQSYDSSEGSTNFCGPYSLQLMVDGKEYYFREMDRFAFGNTRYSNSMTDYESLIQLGRRIHRLYLEPGNKTETILRQQNRGILSFAEAGRHNIQIIAKDIRGNASELRFDIDYTPSEPPVNNPAQTDWSKETQIIKPGFKAVIPAGALYTSTTLTYTASPGPKGTYSSLHTLHNELTPLQKSISLSVAPEGLPESLRSKALLVRINKQGQRTSAGGSWNNGFVEASTLSFGGYAIAVDTTPPSITPLNLPISGAALKSNYLKLKITDDLSGIKSFRALIDGKWALFDWDAKNNLFVHELDAKRTSQKKDHQLAVTVTDQKDNTSSFSTGFIW